jgi:hypothetical protein
MDLTSKRCNDYPARGFCNDSLKRIGNDSLTRNKAWPFDISGVANNSEDTIFAEMAKLRKVERLSIDWRLIQLEVTRVHNRPSSCLYD